MKITLDGTDLARALAFVGRAVRPNCPVPILETVLLRGREGEISLIATDDEHQIQQTLTAEVTGDRWEVALPAKRLTEIVNGLKGATISVTIEENWQAILQSGRSRYRLSGINPVHFPEFGATVGEPIWMPAALLQMLARFCLVSVARDDSRPTLCGAQLSLHGQQMTMTAFNGRSLSVCYCPLDDSGEQLSAILSTATLKAILNLPKEVEEVALLTDGQTVRFGWSTGSITARLIAGTFPDTSKLLDRKPETWIGLEKEGLKLALQRLQAICKEDMDRVQLETGPGLLWLRARGLDVGQGLEEVPCSDDGAVQVTLPGERLLQMLSVLEGDYLQMGFTGGSRPVWLYGETRPEFLGMLMPLVPA